MASAELLREELSCSICLNIYTEPETLRCGHNFCRECIEKVLEVQKDSGSYSCPECREEYAERPLLEKNRKLCNIAKHFLVTQKPFEGSEVACTYCVHAPVPAAKTCLQCETSLCEVHLSIHNSSVEHVLIAPIASLASRKCQTHNKLLEYHCCEDSICICVSCFAIGAHRMHKVETLDEAMMKKKKTIRKVLDKFTSKVGGIEKQVQDLQNLQSIEHKKASDVKNKVTSLFEDARKDLEEKEAWILDIISKQADKIDSKISRLIQELETQKESMFEKMRHLEEVCKITDPLLVLEDEETYHKDFFDPVEPSEKRIIQHDSSEMKFDEGLIAASLHVALSNLTAKAQKGFYITKTVDIVLDPDTACNNVLLSDDLKLVTWAKQAIERPVNPKRFQSYCQVIAKNSFDRGQCYWEVDTSESDFWMVGLAYASIPLEGLGSKIGNHENSWCLNKSDKGFFVINNSLLTKLYFESPIRRLGIYLEYEAGYLSFYQLCDSAKLLYTFHSTFNKPLHPAFVVWKEGWIRIRS